MLGETSGALRSYLDAIGLFEETLDYCKRHGYPNLADGCADALEWLWRLARYVKILQLDPPDPTQTLVIYPLQSRAKDRKTYVLAEFVLVRPVSEQDVEAPTRSFLLQLGKAWHHVYNITTLGYQVEATVRWLDADNRLKSYKIRPSNPAALIDDKVVLPAGVLFSLAQAPEATTLSEGDYLLTPCDPASGPNSIALLAPVFQPDRGLDSAEHIPPISHIPRVLGN
jgi:hypothetical protein